MHALKNRINQAELMLGMVKEEADRLFPVGKQVQFYINSKQKNPSTGTVLRTDLHVHDFSHGTVRVSPHVVIEHDQAKPRSRYPVRHVALDQQLIDLNSED